MSSILQVLLTVLLLGCAGGAKSGSAPETLKAVSAAPQPVTPSPSPLRVPPKGPVLRLHGSNTLGFSLAPALVRGFLASKGASEIRVNDQSRASERVWIQAKLRDAWISVEILAPGTKLGFASLAERKCDLVLASRQIFDDEVKALSAQGDLTGPGSETVVAMDGIAIVVHPNNPISRLSTQQLADVFAGKISNWSELGGPSLPIVVYSRDANSGTYEMFWSLVMREQRVVAKSLFEDSAKLVNAVLDTPGAIGFVGLPYVKQAKALAIEDGGPALLPTPFTVAAEDYPLSRRLFFYTPASPSEPLTRELIEYTVSDAGQKVVDASGFIPLSLSAEAAAIPPRAPPAYVKLATGAVRVSTSLRFKSNGTDPDAKALRDLDRLTRYLASQSSRGRQIALAGYADSEGSPETNAALAKQRVTTIAAHLRERGLVPTTVESFGSALPIASNDTAAGRARNRRVEVWLR